VSRISYARPDVGFYPTATYAWYVVVLLTLTYIVSFVDRYILSLLIEPIKASLHLTVQEPPRRKKLKTDEAGDDEAVITTVRETLAFFCRAPAFLRRYFCRHHRRHSYRCRQLLGAGPLLANRGMGRGD